MRIIRRVLARIVLSTLLAVCLLANAQTMQVINCEEWVSLRSSADTASERLAQVPLGEYVYNCKKYTNEFTYAEFEGMSGYILTKYLTAVEEEPAETVSAAQFEDVSLCSCSLSYEDLMQSGRIVFRQAADGMMICAVRDTSGNCETLRVEGFSEGSPKWGWAVGFGTIGQVNATDAFLWEGKNGVSVFLYHSSIGLMNIDPKSGSLRWTVSAGQLGTGGGICHAVDENGVIYLAGYFSANPVAVNPDGTVKWIGNPGSSDIYWPYAITTENNCVTVDYESGTERGHYVVTYAPDGAMIWADIAEE